MKNRFLLSLLLLVLYNCSEEPSPAPIEMTDASASSEITRIPEPISEPIPERIPEPEPLPEILVLTGLDEAIAWMESENWWGEEDRTQQLTVPHALMTSIDEAWKETSNSITVQTKKEIFYRFMLPLIMHANEIVLDRRERLAVIKQQVESGISVAQSELQWLTESAITLRIIADNAVDDYTESPQAILDVIDEALYKLDIIPAGLVLGQAAYESGYGTSRFAAAGNALFGQWSFDGSGITPQEQRKSLGDYRIAAFEWPFDSVRSYFINISRHPAYEELRRLRAEMRAANQPLDSLALAAGLVRYSERGEEYVETLRSIIRVNNLTVGDNAVFRDEPLRFIVSAQTPEEAIDIRAELDAGAASGELTDIITRMDLE
jgi:Bax protein